MSDSTKIDLSFELTGDVLPCDHGYALYGAISRILPAIHESNGIAIHPIRGQIVGDRQMRLTDKSRLVLRTVLDRIGDLLPLAGKQLVVAGRTLRVGAPQIFSLTPTTAVRSRLVVIKVSSETPTAPTEDAFLNSLRRKLTAFGLTAESPVTLVKRRTIRVHHKEVVGYEVIIEHLTAEESLALQSNAPADSSQRFGRNHMGCGIFTALLPRGSVV
jgi:CRISPR-associated protein Cas6